MSAICAIVQADTVHLMTDGLCYLDGVPLEVDRRKTYPIGNLRAAVACTGPALLGEHYADQLQQFLTFDELILHGEESLGKIFHAFVVDHRDGDAIANLVLAGWHERANRPALYVMNLETDGEKLAWARSLRTENSHPEERAFQLLEVDCTSIPCPSAAEFRDAGYDLVSPLDGRDACADMLHVMQIQRRMAFDGKHLVGGEVTMTSINATGVTQRIAHRWNEDRVGELVAPAAIDWLAIKLGGQPLPKLSRLQRERLEKKQRKMKMRSAS